MRLFAALVLLATASGGADGQECIAAATAPALDHIVLVVRDLDAAANGFRSHGFRIKNGRLHANNLLNRHIKFRDATSIELMTVQGAPGDSMAMRYAAMLSEGEGGVYVALGVPDASAVFAAAGARGLHPHRSSSGPWQFTGFAADSALAGVFFTSGGLPANDPDSLLTHSSGATGLIEAWIEGGPELAALLEDLGATSCGRVQGGEAYALRNGRLVITPRRPGFRSRVLGAVLASPSASERIRPHSAFWLEHRPRR